MFLVVGLGNPGRRYDGTRHNVGFDVVDRLCSRWGIDPTGRAQFGSLISDGVVAGTRALLARPQKYMNCSGQPVASLLGYYKLSAERVVVVHDEMGHPFGAVRCQAGGGHGGHNGLRDLIQHIGREFLRVRVGIGRPPSGWDPADYVLGKWSSSEQPQHGELVDTSSDAVESILRDGLIAAQNRFNVRAAHPSSDTNLREQ